GPLGRSAFDHVQHDHAPGLVQAQLGGDLGGDLVGLDAQGGVGGPAGLEPLAAHVDGGGTGDGEADGDRPLLGRDVGNVDADHLAAAVDQRPAGVAGRDGGVGLDQVDQGTDALLGRAGDLAVEAGDDPGGDGVLEPEGAAHGHGQLAHGRQLLLEGGRLQVLAVDVDHGQVGVGVGGPDPAVGPLAVEEGDIDVADVPDHVGVGDHDPVLGPDDPTAGPPVVGDGHHRRLDLADDRGDVA